MASEVEICNGALQRLGATAIISLTEGTEAARLCFQHYFRIRNSVLRSHFWNFAVGRVELALLVETPVFGFAYKYQLPTDCLRVIELNVYESERDLVKFQIEGRTLVTDESNAAIKYIKVITDPNQFDALFTELVELTLAKTICYSLTQDKPMLQYLTEETRRLEDEARLADAQEGSPKAITAYSWIASRL